MGKTRKYPLFPIPTPASTPKPHLNSQEQSTPIQRKSKYKNKKSDLI
jgi:hypothetical protein